jgi:hypothetical protein
VKDDAPPEIPNPEREEGIYAHTLFAECLSKDGYPVLENETTESVMFALEYVRALDYSSVLVEEYYPFPGTLFVRSISPNAVSALPGGGP